MMSDPFYGSIAFRDLTDIATGEAMQHSYAGRTLPRKFLDDSVPPNMRWMAEFDGALYLAANPDVAASGMGAMEHYWLHGRQEGRKLRP
jgi:hypothetical protein